MRRLKIANPNPSEASVVGGQVLKVGLSVAFLPGSPYSYYSLGVTVEERFDNTGFAKRFLPTLN
jgi:hypothetical protein